METADKKQTALMSFYGALAPKLKKQLRDEFCANFHVGRSAFYDAIEKAPELMPLGRAIFLADYFNVPVKQLVMPPEYIMPIPIGRVA